METGSKSPIIFALGNTFIDCSAVGSHELLEKYGLGFGLPGNLTPDQYPVLEDLKSCPNYHELTAGSAINTVRCINYVLKKDHNIENSVLYFGAISKDDSGKTVKDFLDSEGIQYAFDEHDDNYTGKCAIIIVDGERTPVSNCGVNDFIRTEHFLNNKHMIDP